MIASPVASSSFAGSAADCAGSSAGFSADASVANAFKTNGSIAIEMIRFTGAEITPSVTPALPAAIALKMSCSTHKSHCKMKQSAGVICFFICGMTIAEESKYTDISLALASKLARRAPRKAAVKSDNSLGSVTSVMDFFFRSERIKSLDRRCTASSTAAESGACPVRLSTRSA